MALSFDSTTSLLLVDVSSGPKTIQLPYASERPGRVLTIKDSGFCSANKAITILCAGSGFSGDKLDRTSSSYSLIFPNGYIIIISDPSMPGWRIVGKSEINLPPQFNDVVTVNLSSMNANLSTISTNNIHTKNISAAIATVERGFFKYAEIENLSVNVLFANIVSTAITQDITGVTVDNAYISSATISSLVAYSTFTSQLHVNDIHAKDISSGVINLGFSTLSTGIANLTNTSLSAFSSLSTAIAQLDYSTTVRYTSTVVGIQALTAASVRSTVNGLGTVGYVSTTALAAYLNGLGSDGYVSTTTLDNTIASSIKGLGTANYVSTTGMNNTITSSIKGLGTANYVSTQSMTSSLQGLGSLGYISTIGTNSAYITSTTQGLGTLGYISTIGTDSNYIGSTIAGLGSLAYVSTASLVSTVFGLQNTAAFSTANGSATSTIYGGGFVTTLTATLTSTIEGLSYAENLNSSLKALGTQGYVSSLSLRSTVAGLGTAGYVSTSGMAQALRSTVGGLGRFYVSSITLNSTIDNLGQTFVSTSGLTDALVSSLEGSAISLQSTIDGLGELSYISTTSLTQTLISTINGLGKFYISSTGLRQALASSVNGLGSYYISTSALKSSIDGLGELSYISSTTLDKTIASTIDGLASYYISSSTLQSSIDGLGQKFVSTASLTQAITTAVNGLGQTYISSTSLKSSLEGLGSLGYTSSINSDSIRSTVAGLGSSKYVSSSALVSTVVGLGSTEFFTTTTAYVTSTVYGLGYISTLAATLTSTVTGESYGSSLTSSINTLGSIGYLSTPTLTSTIEGLGQKYISTLTVVPASLASTTQGLGQSYVSTQSLTSTVEGLGQIFVSTLTVVPASLTSTVQGLGQRYVSTQSLISTVQGLGQRYVSSISLISTTQGLGETYVSTASLFSSIEGLGEIYVSTLTVVPASLTSTVQGLGQRYVSTQSLTSTVQGLGQRYISTLTVVPASLASTTQGLGETYVSTVSLISSLEGLGSLGYISTVITNSDYITSTTQGLGTIGYVSTIIVNQGYVTSTVRGLGTLGYVSSITGINSAGNVGINAASNTSNALFVNGSMSVINNLGVGGANNPFTGSSGSSSFISPYLVIEVYINSSSSNSTGLAVEWNGSYWLAGGYNAAGTISITKSFDGITWTDSVTAGGNNPFPNNTYRGMCYGLAWNGSYWIAVGSSAVCIAKSFDGINWVPSTNNPFSGGVGQGIAWNGSYWIAVGFNAFMDTCIIKSFDGMTWTPATNNPFNMGYGNGIAWNGSYWVAVGRDFYDRTLATSTDGMTWTLPEFDPVGVMGAESKGIAWNGSYWIVLVYYDGSSYILKSTDANIWFDSISLGGNNPFEKVAGIAWNGSYWIAVGSGTNCIAKSFDGINWTGSLTAGGNNPFTFGYSVEWNGSYWIAVGLSSNSLVSIVKSSDGINWTTSTGSSGNLSVTGALTTTGITTVGSLTVKNATTLSTLTVARNIVAAGNAIAFGNRAATTGQGDGGIALGAIAAETGQGTYGVALGYSAGKTNQGTNAVAIGNSAGYNLQSTNAIAIGNSAGYNNQGSNAIAIGNQAGLTSQVANSIILNASGSALNATQQGLFVKPIRNLIGLSTLYYDNTTGEITYAGSASGGGPSLTTSTIILSDYSGISANSLFTSSSLLYYNSSIIAGATVAALTTAVPGSAAVSSAVGFVTTYAGNLFNGSRDGQALSAGFNTLRGLTFDPTFSTLTTIDSGNRLVRRVALATSSATTVAGAYALSGFTDGYFSTARLLNPYYSVSDGEGNIYFTDQGSNLVRKLTPAGFVSTIAGFGNVAYGLIDGFGSNARFSNPTGITIDSLGANLYVVDTWNHAVRRINLSTMYVSTIAGGVLGSADGVGRKGIISGPFGVNIDQAGANLYIAPSQRVLRRYNFATSTLHSMAGSASNAASASNGFLSNIGFNGMFNAIPDAGGNVYVSDYYGWRLRYITSNGIGTTVIGSNNGFADGPGATATVVPQHSIMDSTYTNIYIADPGNNRIRRYNIATSTVTTVVGNGNAASIDGLGGGTRFNFPTAMIIDSANANIYIGDNNNNRIRRLNLATSTVTTYAGNGTGNAIDGISTNTASITSPEAMAIDSAGTLYYCDRNFHRVRKITTAGSVVSIVGSSTANGSADGIGAGALLTYPSGICIDSTGTNAYITEYNNNWVRRVVLATGQVIRLAGSGSTGSNDAVGVLATFNGPTGICIDNTNTNLYVCDQANNRIRQIVIATSNVTTLAGSGTPAFADGTGGGASFSLPRQICFNSGNVFITDFNNNRIRRIVVSTGVVTTIAGSVTASSVDGAGASASFNGPFGITIDSAGTNLYIGDYSSHCIRRIRLSDSNVLTISGSNASAGYRDGIGAAGASLNGPTSIGIDSTNANLYFTEGNPSNRVRRVNLATSVVSTIAGSGTASAVDGFGTSASFFNPNGIAVDTLGNLWVSEISSYLIRRITLATTYVSTIAGNGSNTQDGIGINAAFKRPWGLCVDPAGANLFIAEYDGGRIRRLNIATTNVTTLIGTTVGFDMDGNVNGAMFNYPEGIAIDSTNSNLYVSDTVANKIRVINLNTTYVSTVCGTGGAGNGDGIGINATLNRPGAMRFDTMSNLYFVENNGYRIKKLALATTYVSTCAGTGGSAITDGNGTAAAFATLGDITFDSNASTMYITDQHRIRFMNMSTMTVSTLAGGGASYVDNVSGSGAQFSNNFPGTPCIDSNNTLFVTEFSRVSMVLSNGRVSTLTTAMTNITGIALDTTHSTLFIADAGTTRIWAMNLSTVTLSLKAGGGTIAGDGWALGAAINYPRGIACDSNNNVYFGEGNNNVLRRITPDGRLITVAGNGRGGTVINGFMGARFVNPSGIALDSTGCNAFIADGAGGGSRIRRFNLTTFNASTIAGSGSNTSTDGSNIFASFLNVQGIARDASDNSYIGEQFRIRSVTSSGYVSTLIGSNSSGANDGIYTSVRLSSAIPQMAMAGSELYFCDQGNNRIRRVNVTTGQTITVAGNGTGTSTDGSWGGNRFSNPQATCLDPTKAFLFIADPGNNVIRRMTLATGLTETYAGSGTGGFLDGNSYTAQFNNPMGIWMDSAGILYVSDAGNNRIRKVDAGRNVTTLAGNGATSFSNGIGTAATFNYPQGLVTDSTATRLYVSDFSNNRIRIITLATSNVATLAGSGTATSTDGIGAVATLYNPQGIAIDATDTNLYVMDVNGSKFRSIVIATSNVSTIAGNGTYVNTDGTGANAAFHYSQSVALDGVGNAYTGNRGGSFLIRKIVLATGVVTTFAGNATNAATDGTGTGASFGSLGGGMCSDNNFLYMTDNSNLVRRVSLPGAVTTTIGGTRGTSGYFNGFFSTSPATFNSPYGCALDNTNTNLYISEQGGARIRRIVLATGAVTTMAGTGTSTWVDGTGLSAGFNAPKGIFVDNANGNLWIVENSRVRKLVLATSNVTTIAGAATTGSNDAIGALATFNDPRSVILNPAGTTLFVTDYGNFRIRSIDVATSNVSSIAGFSQGCADGTGVGNSLANPVNMTVDFNNNLYVKDVDNNRVRMLNLNTGYLSTFTTLTNTNGMAADPTNSSILYMTTTSNIFRADISTQTFATFVGSNTTGTNDGFGPAAGFNGMTAACVDRTGAIYITEASRIRKIT
jgi:sugar lactone lactonase YvrE